MRQGCLEHRLVNQEAHADNRLVSLPGEALTILRLCPM
jgi:hypothetical protein